MVKIDIGDQSEVIEHNLAELAAYISKCKRAVVVAGAGISCSGGIPVSTNAYLSSSSLPRLSNNWGSPLFFLPVYAYRIFDRRMVYTTW